jgi:hypothetical protein
MSIWNELGATFGLLGTGFALLGLALSRLLLGIFCSVTG